MLPFLKLLAICNLLYLPSFRSLMENTNCSIGIVSLILTGNYWKQRIIDSFVLTLDNVLRLNLSHNYSKFCAAYNRYKRYFCIVCFELVIVWQLNTLRLLTTCWCCHVNILFYLFLSFKFCWDRKETWTVFAYWQPETDCDLKKNYK